MLPVNLECQFFIAPSVFSNVFLLPFYTNIFYVDIGPV
jgi:hypothetical protein